MKLYDRLIQKKSKLSVVGLGYVGLPIAVAFSEKVDVIGFDLDNEKIRDYTMGKDLTLDVGDESLQNTKIKFSSDAQILKEAQFHIIAVPTPINTDKTPDLSPVITASRMVGENLCEGSIVVYESTVYPGVTEDICIPILEQNSGLKCGKNFWVGYSPERINPGDRIHKLADITKIVSGMDDETLEQISNVYELVIKAGVHRVSSIKAAEAAKVVENSQRDINIAFMNEMAIVFERMGIDTIEVIEAMDTKWNALGFRPGLVGGHCIGVDPYYFIYQAERLGYHSQIISAGRKVNDDMGRYVADIAIKKIALSGMAIKGTKVAILGITFKENCNDVRNSKVVDIITRLKEYGIDLTVADYYADSKKVLDEYRIILKEQSEIKDVSCVIFAVAHEKYRNISDGELIRLFGDSQNHIILDIKGIFQRDRMERLGADYWRL